MSIYEILPAFDLTQTVHAKIFSINDFFSVPQSPMTGTSDEIKMNKELLSKGTFISYENCVYLGGIYVVKGKEISIFLQI
jgi:hypothetical protein